MMGRFVLPFALGAAALLWSAQGVWADPPQQECPDGQKAQCSIDGCNCPKPPPPLVPGIGGSQPTSKPGPAICHTGNQKTDSACLKTHRLDKLSTPQDPK